MQITGTPFLDGFSCVFFFLASLTKGSFLDLENKNKPEEKQQQQKHTALAQKDNKLWYYIGYFITVNVSF